MPNKYFFKGWALKAVEGCLLGHIPSSQFVQKGNFYVFWDIFSAVFVFLVWEDGFVKSAFSLPFWGKVMYCACLLPVSLAIMN